MSWIRKEPAYALYTHRWVMPDIPLKSRRWLSSLWPQCPPAYPSTIRRCLLRVNSAQPLASVYLFTIFFIYLHPHLIPLAEKLVLAQQSWKKTIWKEKKPSSWGQILGPRQNSEKREEAFSCFLLAEWWINAVFDDHLIRHVNMCTWFYFYFYLFEWPRKFTGEKDTLRGNLVEYINSSVKLMWSNGKCILFSSSLHTKQMKRIKKYYADSPFLSFIYFMLYPLFYFIFNSRKLNFFLDTVYESKLNDESFDCYMFLQDEHAKFHISRDKFQFLYHHVISLGKHSHYLNLSRSKSFCHFYMNTWG